MLTRTIFAAAVLALAATPGAMAQTAGDAAAGAKVFNKCRACHAVGPGAENKVGPELNGMVGRAVASVPDYKYSPALLEYEKTNPVWDAANLAPWLANPKAVVAKTKMIYPGLKKPDEIANVIAYLATFGATGEPVAPPPN